ncbi:MAG: electron transfer flavoprotein subunit alpha/FixB family protein [Acidaminococcales bacterium]|nr:electron transfer flavoprotein subunit alpha/FixB family protein [Acidaminococcales bacterium]
MVIAAHIIGKPPKTEPAIGKKEATATGPRKNIILKGAPAEELAKELAKRLKADGCEFNASADIDAPIAGAERVVAVGKGIGDAKNLELARKLAARAGAALGSSRPVAESLRYLPLDRYIGMSGQIFSGKLYIACGISGAIQHLKGIKDAGIIVAVNNDPDAPIFKNCDYGIVGDLTEVLPLLTAALS